MLPELTARENASRLAYQEDLRRFMAGEISASCLSFMPRWHCVQQFPVCYLGEAQPVCSFLCEAFNRRCAQSVTCAEPASTPCSGVGSGTVGGVVAALVTSAAAAVAVAAARRRLR